MRLVFVLLLLLPATADGQSKPPEPAKAPPRSEAEASATDRLTGSVLEHLDAPPYLYLRIKTSTGEVWAAVPQAKIENGATVAVFNPMRMTGFESKALKRTFDEVYFGTLAPEGAVASDPAGHPKVGPMQPAAPIVVGRVEKAGGADARTVSETWAQKASLEGKTVVIRGVVVRYNAGVMGKNWIHLQDGSGDAGQGTNDIAVTTLDEAAKGDTVTVTGTVRTNKDLGAGYSYAVIIEDAKLVRR